MDMLAKEIFLYGVDLEYSGPEKSFHFELIIIFVFRNYWITKIFP